MEPLITVRSQQDSDYESHGVNSACLSVPVILREIFQCFSNQELIQLSLVNKQWNYDARSLMRQRGNLIASLNKNHTCKDVRDFASDLQRMKLMTRVVPFSGMTISVGGPKFTNRDLCLQSSNGELEPVYEEILGGLRWKHLTIRHLVGWEEHKSCQVLVLQKKLFRKLNSALEELSVQLEWNKSEYFREELLQDCYFPCLKTFRLLNECRSDKSEWSDLIKTVVSSAPKLQVLYTKSRVDLEANLLEGSSAIHVAASSYSPAEDRIPESVVGQLQIQRMHLLEFRSPFSLERFNRITSMLLQSSHTILSSMEINIIFLGPLMNYGICLENVREVELSLDFLHVEEMQPPFWRVAKYFDFTRVFPNLNTVSIRDFPDHHFRGVPAEFNEMIDQVNAALQPPSVDRAVNIKHLKLNYLPSIVLSHQFSFQLLAQMFPQVQKVSITTSGNPFADMGDFWEDLKQIDVTLKWSTLEMFDVIFCGIFPAELAQLREQDDEYLRRVNIVPPMPSIAQLKELRSIQVLCEEGMDAYTGPTDDPTCMFSKVTPLLAFRRCPNLSVTLTSEDEKLIEALGYLRPYVSAFCKKMIRFTTCGA